MRVLKWPVRVDDAPHRIGGGDVLHVSTLGVDIDTVYVWTFEHDVESRQPPARFVRVFGTGQPVPPGAVPLGSCVTAGGALVWHAFDVSHAD